MDEVDHIDVLASDEAAYHTETLDVGPSKSLVFLMHTHRRRAPTPYLVTKTPDPPLSTPHDTTGPLCHPSLLLTPDLPCGLPKLNLSPPHIPPPLTTTCLSPHPIAPPK